MSILDIFVNGFVVGLCRAVEVFGPLAPVDHLSPSLPFLPLQATSLHKVLDPGLQALTAGPLQQGPVLPPSGTFRQPAALRRHRTWGDESALL